MRHRHRTILYVALAGAATLLLLAVWGVAIEPRRLDVRRESAALPDLPPAWEGRQVALVADLHVGMWLGNPSVVRTAVRRLLADRPAAVLIAGDFLQSADASLDADIAAVVRLLAPLAVAGIPTYAVLGNHDYSLNRRGDAKHDVMARRLAAALTRAGIGVLQDSAARIPTPGATNDATEPPTSLYVAGVGSHWAHEDDPAAAIGAVPAGQPYLVLMHNPASFETIAAGRAPLAFAAHTHGGQVRVPFLPRWSWIWWLRDGRMPIDGWARPEYGAAGNRLYVNRGLGMTELPVRLHCRPELTIFTLGRRR